MGLEYLKITPEIMLKISAYDAEAQGRLVMAMIAYALNGEEPEFEGMEKFIWPVLKLDIDRCAASIEKQAANGSRGGRPRQSQTKQDESQSKPSESQKNPEKPNETQSKPSESLNSNTNSNSNSNTNNQEEEEERACAREEATASAAAGEDKAIIGIDGTDLSAAMADYDRAGELVSRYKLPDTDQSREALLMDAGVHGWVKVEKALKDAANGNSRAMLSVNFYRAVLKNQGKPRGSQGAAPSGDTMMRYSADERKATYSAAIVDFDDD
jgi:hypothetical protein